VLRAVARDGCTRLEELRPEAPLGLYRAAGPAPGWAQVWMVGSAGGPLGGDDLELMVEVCDGAALAIGSVAASVALAGGAPSRLVVRVTVGSGASLVWAPEPTVVTAGADHRIDVLVEVAAGAYFWWRDELVLGRAGERPGRCTVHQHADLDREPWARHELTIGAPGWDGGAVVGGHGAIGSVLTTSRCGEPRAGASVADLHPAAGGTLTVALAEDRPALDELLPTPPSQRSRHAAPRVDA
jgi:urease accessory protein